MSERETAGMETDLAGERRPRGALLVGRAGILPRQDIRNLVHRKILQSMADFDPGQFQPASLDLRLGAKAYRVRASFLPGAGLTVAQKLADLTYDEVDLDGPGAVLERDYEGHAQAARNLVEHFFDSDLVLGRLLEEVGL